MSSWLVVTFALVLSASISCGVFRSNVVSFSDACGGKPNRNVVIEGYIANDSSTCSPASEGGRECSFTLSDNERRANVLFPLGLGGGNNQVQPREADGQVKSFSTFRMDELRISGSNGSVIDVEKKVRLSGKTTVLVSSTMAAVCRLDDVKISQ